MYVNPYNMASLQKFYQPGAVIYLLIVCFIQETACSLWDSGFYYESGSRNYTLTLNMKLTPIINRSNKKANEFLVQLTITNNVKECMEVAVTTEENPYIKYHSAPSSYDACVCTASNFFWNIYVSASTYIQASASVLPYKNKCPEFAHLHVDPYQIYNITHYIHVTQ